MAYKAIDPRRYNFVFLALILLLIPLCIYYFVYIPKQTSYFIDRGFRILGVMSNNIDSKITNLSKALKNASKSAQAVTENAEAAGINQSLELVTNLQMVGRPELVKMPAQGENDLSLKLDYDGKNFWLKFNYIKPSQVVQLVLKGFGVQLQARSKLKRIVDPLIIDNTFDNVLVVLDDGQIVYQQDSSKFRITKFDSLKSAKGEKLAFRSLTRSSNLVDVKLGGASYKLFIQPTLIPYLKGPENDPFHRGKWLVCGLTESGRFATQTISINYLFIIGFMLLLVLAVLSWPLLKVIFMNQYERLQISDVLFLALSCLIGFSIFTMIVFDGYAYLGFEHRLDRQLEDFAGEISSNFQTEIQNIYQQIQVYNKSVNDSTDYFLNRRTRTQLLKNPNAVRYPRQYPYLDMVYWMDKDGVQRIKWSTKDRNTPLISVAARDYFRKIAEKRYRVRDVAPGQEMRYWLEPIYSWNTAENLTVVSAPIDNPKLAAGAVVTRLLSVMKPAIPVGFGFAIVNEDGQVFYHSDEKRNLQENILDECDNNRWLRSTLLGRIRSANGVQYLGRGYRFFIQPIKDLPLYLIAFRDKEILRTVNLEILTIAMLLFTVYASLFLVIIGLVYFIRPDYRATWVWPDTIQTSAYQSLIFTYLLISAMFIFWIFSVKSLQVLPIPIMLPFYTFVLTYLVLKGNPRAANHRNRGAYILLYTILALTLLVALLIFQNILLIIIYLLILGVLPIFAVKMRDHKFFKEQKIISYPLVYTLALVFVLLVMSVFPSMAFFKFAYQQQMELYIKHRQLQFVKGLEGRIDRTEALYRDIKTTPSFWKDRLALNNLDIYSDFFFDTRVQVIENKSIAAPDETDWRGKLKQILAMLMPLYNETTIEIRSLVPNASADNLWKWSQNSEEREKLSLILEKNYRRGDQRSIIRLSSVLPDLSMSLPAKAVFAAGMFFLILLLFLLMRFIARRVLLINLHASRNLGKFELSSKDFMTHSVLLIGPPASGKTDLINSAGVHRIDMIQLATVKDWKELINRKKLAGHNVIALDHFEFKLDEPGINSIKLLLLEELIFNQHKKVVVTSTIDPLLYFSSQEPGVGGERDMKTDEQNVLRWSSVFSTFLTYHHEDPGNPDSFASGLTAQEQIMLGENNQFSDSKKKRIADLMDQLFQECKYNAFLQEVGSKIAELPDFADLASEQLVYQVMDWADTYYRTLWGTFTIEEKLVLIHLANNNLINAKNEQTVWKLMRRHYIIKDPVFRLMNKSFTRFVSLIRQPAEIAEWEKDVKKKSNWSRFKTPFLTVVAGITIFLFTTQPGAFDTTFTFVTATAAAIPAVLKILDLFQRSKAATSQGG